MAYSIEQLGDVVTTALEGGIYYWADNIEIDRYPDNVKYAGDAIAHGAIGTITYESEFTKGGEKVTLDVKKLKKGIAAYKKHKIEKALENGRPKPDLYDKDYDLGFDYDAGDADNIIQFAVFGEIVYG